jgi:hypothetical protein
MYVSKKEAWQGLIYSLIYPALLGSMFYDIFSPPTLRSWSYVGQVVIVCIFLVDYLYLYNDWMGQGYPKRSQEIFGDGLVAILYRLSFGFIPTRPTVASVFLASVFFLYLFYEIAQHPATQRFIVVSLLVMLANVVVRFLTNDLYLRTFLFVTTAFTTLILLAFFVFYYAPKYLAERKPSADGKNSPLNPPAGAVESAVAKVEQISDERIYEENSKVTAVFWEWRHKTMRNFFGAIGAVIAVSGWLFQQAHGITVWLCVPFFIGALYSYITYLLDKRHTKILRECYRIGADIEVHTRQKEAIFHFIDKLHYTRGSLTQILHILYVSSTVLFLLSFLTIIIKMYGRP